MGLYQFRGVGDQLMHKGVFLSDDEYRAIPYNAASMIVEAMRCAGIALMQGGKPLGSEREWLCGVLWPNADLLTVPWSESRFNEERSSG